MRRGKLGTDYEIAGNIVHRFCVVGIIYLTYSGEHRAFAD